MTAQILNKEILVDLPQARIKKLLIASSLVSRKALPGQFVVVMVSRQGERIPLTIVESDAAAGTVTLIFQESGFTTGLLGKVNVGDSLYALAGPLGNATEIKNYGKVVVIGGGVGIAEIYPVAKALKSAGNEVISVLGARSKDLLILEKELRSVSDKVYITTDDGSYGRKGFVTDILGEILAGSRQELVYAVGPIAMMRRVSELSASFAVRTIVSLNALMIDATGMCGCCRVVVDGKTKFSCIDGPEFDGQKIDWKGLEDRNRAYSEKERHICNLRTTLKNEKRSS